MFLKNYWYVAAESQEIGEAPLGRILLGEPVVLYRTSSGAPAALEDRCCHRRLPLSCGRVVGERLQCAYHGLEFDSSGQCVAIPAQDAIPSNARVKSYPIVERHRWIWIWMGDPALANPDKIPDFHWLEDPSWGAKSALFPAKCNWQLIIDNLLDLTHLTYVHGATIGTQANTFSAKVEVESGPEYVRVMRWTLNQPPPPTFTRIAGLTGNVDRWQIIEFTPPGYVKLDVGATPAGTGAREGIRKGGLCMYNLNAITPETESTSHYFWGQAQSFSPQDTALTEKIFEEIHFTFKQDIPIVEAQQRSIDLNPKAPTIGIKADAGPIRARRLIDQLLRVEADHVSPQAVAAE